MSGDGKKVRFSQLSVKSKVIGIAMVLVTLIAAVFSFYQYSLYAVQAYLILGIIEASASIAVLVLLLAANQVFHSRPALCIGCILAVILSILSYSSTKWPFTSKDETQYEKQMRYLEQKHSKPLFFPEDLPSKVLEYEIRFDPGYFGGNGYVLVSFRCEGLTLSEYRKIARKQAILSLLDINEVKNKNLSEQHRAHMAELFGVSTEELLPYFLEIALPPDIDDHPNTKVFIMSCEYDVDDPQTEAILIDVAGGWVCFSRRL